MRVIWSIDVEADTVGAAAAEALRIHRDPTSTATVFVVDGVMVDAGPLTACCLDGWIPGTHGIERCDDCRRFPDDDAARDHVANLLRELAAAYGADDDNDSPAPAFIRRALRDDICDTCEGRPDAVDECADCDGKGYN